MSALSNSFTSKIAKTPRPVEEVVVEKMSRETTTRDLVQQTLVSKESHFITVDLTKRLLRAKSEREVDAIIHLAVETSIDFNNRNGLTENPVYFDLRIRNAELIAREMIRQGKKINLNPIDKAVIVELAVTPVDTGVTKVISSKMVDNWGSLTNALSHGYRVVG